MYVNCPNAPLPEMSSGESHKKISSVVMDSQTQGSYAVCLSKTQPHSNVHAYQVRIDNHQDWSWISHRVLVEDVQWNSIKFVHSTCFWGRYYCVKLWIMSYYALSPNKHRQSVWLQCLQRLYVLVPIDRIPIARYRRKIDMCQLCLPIATNVLFRVFWWHFQSVKRSQERTLITRTSTASVLLSPR